MGHVIAGREQFGSIEVEGNGFLGFDRASELVKSGRGCIQRSWFENGKVIYSPLRSGIYFPEDYVLTYHFRAEFSPLPMGETIVSVAMPEDDVLEDFVEWNTRILRTKPFETHGLGKVQRLQDVFGG